MSIPVLSTAGQILEEVGISHPHVDPFKVACHYGYQIRIISSPNQLDCGVDLLSKVILINQDNSKHLQRFSVAHCLGHGSLHRHLQTVFSDKFSYSAIGTSRMENEANQFATELLIPKNWLLARASIPHSVLAEIFDVPIDAIRGRFNDIRSN